MTPHWTKHATQQEITRIAYVRQEPLRSYVPCPPRTKLEVAACRKCWLAVPYRSTMRFPRCPLHVVESAVHGSGEKKKCR
jgi:hypothetical protein